MSLNIPLNETICEFPMVWHTMRRRLIWTEFYVVSPPHRRVDKTHNPADPVDQWSKTQPDGGVKGLLVVELDLLIGDRN